MNYKEENITYWEIGLIMLDEYPPTYSFTQFLGEGFNRFHNSIGKCLID